MIISSLSEGGNLEAVNEKIKNGHENLIKEINENSNIQLIIKIKMIMRF